MGAAPLPRLPEPGALADLLAAAAALVPECRVAVLDVAGNRAAGAGDPPSGGWVATCPIEADGVPIGSVVVQRPAAPDPTSAAPTADAIARLVAAAIAVAAGAPAPASAEGEGEPAIEARRPQLDTELAIGRQIQLSLMPRRFPDLPGWEIAAAYEAAREVGGDLYDAFLLRDRADQLAIVVADVTGKEIPAAILMADARALIHAAADHSPDPAVTLARVNRILVAERATSLFVTVAHGVIDARSGALSLASAGHEPTFVVRGDGSLAVLEPPGRLMGVVDDIAATSVRFVVEPGDTLVAYTDGVTEARSPDGLFFGEERFQELLRTLAGRPATEVVEAIVNAVSAFRAGAEPSDDLTLLVVRRESVGGA